LRLSTCQLQEGSLAFYAVLTEIDQYLPVLMLLALALAFSFGMLGFSVLVGKRGRHNAVKDTPYECGMIPNQGGTRLSVRFYLVAMLFILFDIEVVFLYPWAVVYRDLLVDHANLIFGSMLSFLGVLLVGYIYLIRKRAFDWRN
jgi:NADH-quinone oxidoreductase subunit A